MIQTNENRTRWRARGFDRPSKGRECRGPSKLVVVLLSVFFTLTATWFAHHAQARLSEGATQFNDVLIDASPLLQRMVLERAHEHTTLLLNGASLRLQVSSLTGDPVETTKRLVKRFMRDCGEPLESAEGQTALFDLPPLVQESEGEGVAHCLKPRRAFSFERLQTLLSRVSANTDLTEWGVFQTLLIRPGEAGSTALTIEVMAGLIPSKMFPTQVDAPGADHPELPRPDGRRILSAAETSTPLVNAYEMSQSPQDTIATYANILQQGSHRHVKHQSGSHALIVESEGHTWVAAASATEIGSTLTIARLPD